MISRLKVVLVVFAVTVALSNAKSVVPKQSSTKTPFEFDEIVPNAYGQRGFGGTWISDKEFTYTLSGDFVKYNVETKVTEKILTKEFIEEQAWSGPTFRLSDDNMKVLVRHAQRQIFRHSTVSKFTIVFLDSSEAPLNIADGDETQIAFFTPNGNGLAYIKDNNIYFLNFEKLTLPNIITSDGITDVIYNGIPDWVYEEEVLGTDAATWFSPDGSKMAFIRFDDEDVREFTYELYGEGDRQYPEEIRLRYPKAGTTNPSIELYIVDDLETATKQKLQVPIDVVSDDHILGTVFWVNDQTVGAIWLNRRQNQGVFVTYDAPSYAMEIIMEINEPSGWIDVNTPKCDANSVCYFVNSFDNWPTLTSVDTKNKSDVKRLSPSGKTVLSINGIEDGVFYYTSTPDANQSFNRHVYANNDCLSCEIKTPEGNDCIYASASFSKDFSHYVLTCSGPDPSFASIYKTEGRQELTKWEENEELRTRLAEKDIPQIKVFHVPITGGFQGVVRMTLPNAIDFEGNDERTKYPMLVRVYAGPGSIRVLNYFGISYQTYQASKKNIVHVEIDGRGMSQNGNDMMFTVNNALGTVEIEDQIAVTKYLVENYKFIDPKRVAIWGWSYGGYATAMTLSKDTDLVFKCGLSVAPVTAWRFYDTIYTERYMGIDSNTTNYLDSDVSTKEHVEQIGKHEFFLIHGNADDNVHYQQSMVLARALEEADIMFEQLSYPEEAHSITGTQRHLYHALDHFWDKCFKED